MKKLIALMLVTVLIGLASCTKKSDLIPMEVKSPQASTGTVTFTYPATTTAFWNQVSVNGVVKFTSTSVKTYTFTTTTTNAVVSVKQYQNKFGMATTTFTCSGIPVNPDVRNVYFGNDATHPLNVSVDTVGDNFIAP